MSLMEFWGAEVKSGESLEVDPGQGVVLHLSQASIGEVKKDKANERICLFVKVDDQKLTLGTVSSEKLPQISFDLVFEKKFQLSHNWKKGSVYFTGYRAYVTKDDESSESDTYFDTEANSEEDFRVDPHHIGKSELEVKQAAKPNVTTAKQVRIVEPNKVEDADEDVDEDTSSDEESSDESDDEEHLIDSFGSQAKASSEEESSEDDDGSDDDSSEDEDKEIPKELKAKANTKRSMEPAKKTPADKKAKFSSPEKTDIKKFSGRVATPHPSKQTVTKQQTPKSGRAYPCKSCNRSFSSETGLQSHTKAKHSAAQ
ncbi:histone deacetylase HDT1-like isoform X2 [Carya illinoinensis]|uniref:histone deacetylase HDT1-like isoform X2 n=1 Tax=Carya illinoinensis TaxID=32201 RepID=UPI001C71D81E|nr:histone deacetylase HDT1-like isoform X2 [Carya illinoinensis]